MSLPDVDMLPGSPLLPARGVVPVPDGWPKRRREEPEKAAVVEPFLSYAASTAKGARRVRVDWLWQGRIPEGMFGLLVGDPGVGKSTLGSYILSRLVMGKPLSTDDTARLSSPIKAVHITSEEDLNRTLFPRQDALGTDDSRISYLKGGVNPETGETFGWNLKTGLRSLSDLCQDFGASIVLIDGLTSFLGPGLDPNAESDVRSVLVPLHEWAEASNTAVTGIMHTNKGQGPPMSRIIGSRAFGALARFTMFCARNHQAGDGFLLLPDKDSLGGHPPGLEFSIVTALVPGHDRDGNPCDLKSCRVEMGGVSDQTCAQALAMPDPKAHEEKSRVEQAADFLKAWLADGPKHSSLLYLEAAKEHHSEASIRRAQVILGIKPTFHRPTGKWIWALP